MKPERREKMHDELYADGIGEITVTGSIVRINLVSLSPTERDEKGAPKMELRQRVIMPLDAFANAADLMQKARLGLAKAGAIRRTDDMAAAQIEGPAESGRAAPGAPVPNASPNFN
jgi:hypothetical protein